MFTLISIFVSKSAMGNMEFITYFLWNGLHMDIKIEKPPTQVCIGGCIYAVMNGEKWI